MRQFENLIAWQKAQTFTVNIYQTFVLKQDYGFQDQIRRASISISNNIAEGCDRYSDADFVRFLNIARSSNSEVRSMIYLAEKLKYIDQSKKEDLIAQSLEISRLILGIIKSIRVEK